MKNIHTSLAVLVGKLIHKGFIRAAVDINDILYEVMQKIDTEEEDMESQDTNDSSVAANLIGLREDGTVSNMNQGYTLEPFFSNYGDLE
jgi:hypothetical protein